MRTLVLTGLTWTALVAVPAWAEDWPAWRGPDANGHYGQDRSAADRRLPLTWSPTQNVGWKTALPGPGNSTPVLCGSRIFLTQSTDNGKQRSLWCLNREDGKLLWQRTVEYAQAEPTHSTNPHGSASAVTDGQRVVISFGSAGLVCYDLEGRQLWHRDLGPCRHIWGNAASPVLFQDLVLLNFGPGERTFLVAVDKATGREVWRVEEPGGKFGDKGGAEWIGSWSTPIVAHVQGRAEVLLSWPGSLKAYAPHTGQLLWTCQGLGRLVYTSPLVGPQAIVAMSGFGGPALAVRPGGNGDVTQTHRLWQHPSAPQRIGSGVIVGERIYMVNEPGTFQCIELMTGKVLCTERVGAGAWGSLLYAAGRLYVTNLQGETVVLAAKPALEVLARNPLNERTLASLAVADGAIFIRTYRHLWCIRAPSGD